MNAVAETTGLLNFMEPETRSSLFRTGEVFIKRDAKGDTTESGGVALQEREVPLINGRLSGDRAPRLMDNGFELVSHPLDNPALDFMAHGDVVASYYEACEQLVMAEVGGQAFAFDHNVRSAGGKAQVERLKGGQNVQGPAHVVHGDYTLRSAGERLQQLTQLPGVNDTYKSRLADGQALIPQELASAASRFSIINVWRNIMDTPVATHPMALCDGQSVAPDDLVVFEIHYDDRIGENYFARFGEHQKFYHYPEMTRDEALLIKQWDSAGTLATTNGAQKDQNGSPCTFSFHSAYRSTVPNADAPDRWSIEVRCMVLYPS